MKRLLGILFLFALIQPVFAQEYAFEVSAGADAATTPHTHGDLSLLVSGGGSTKSYSTISARGPQASRFTYAFLQGIQQQVAKFPKGTMFVDTQGGITSSNAVVSGAFTAGGGVTYEIKSAVELVLAGRVFVSPADGGVSPAIQIGLRFSPKQE